MKSDFEASLRECLRDRAGQVADVNVTWGTVPTPLGLEDEVRMSVHSRARHAVDVRIVPVALPRPPRRRALLVAASVLLIGVISTAAAVLPRALHRAATTDTAPAPWVVSRFVISENTPPAMMSEVTAPAGTPVLLFIEIQPVQSNVKTYLQQLEGTSWQSVGPHNVDANGVEFLKLSTPAAGRQSSYRVLVVGVNNRSDAVSAPVTITGR
ncbi:MAG: hypothetical protein M3Z00_13015 [Actinomycetota bacterium]|nr:hypothetical protein [Actinomycetota bacterium]